jgi:hypothetical protein
MDTAGLGADELQRPASFNGAQQSSSDRPGSAADFPTPPLIGQMPTPSMGNPSAVYMQQGNFSGTDPLSFFGNIPGESIQGLQNGLPESMQNNSTMNLDNDFSIMDTSGDLNWENWDQLVRQFGAEVESTAAQPPGVTTAGQYWMGPQWETGGVEKNALGSGGGEWL